MCYILLQALIKKKLIKNKQLHTHARTHARTHTHTHKQSFLYFIISYLFFNIALSNNFTLNTHHMYVTFILFEIIILTLYYCLLVLTGYSIM